MAGHDVFRGQLDQQSGNTVVAVREAFEAVTTMNEFLKNIPSDAAGGDILTKPEEDGGFGYTADEAYLLRVVFEQLNALPVQPILDIGRALTGLS